MTVRYVGPGGSDAANGLSWANRKLTLNGMEDSPVAAGDIVYVAPGIYREQLTCDVSGTSGNPITYVGDVTGQNTDGIGGLVVISGSDNDQTVTRAKGITSSAKNYRTFGNLVVWMTSGANIDVGGGTDWIIKDCDFQVYSSAGVYNFGDSLRRLTVERCRFRILSGAAGVNVSLITTPAASMDIMIRNCYFDGGSDGTNNTGVFNSGCRDISIRNCVFDGCGRAINGSANPSSGTSGTVYNCILMGAQGGIYQPGGSGFTENFNTFWQNGTARTNCATGANSVAYPPLFQPPLRFSGTQFSQPALGQLSQWSQVKRLAGTSEATDDLFGIARPTTSSKKSWGAIQYQEPIRSTTQTYSSSAASLKLEDAGEVQFYVPVTATSTTISVRAYREANYAGTNPTMIIRQPGQADRTTTDSGSASAWNLLTDTFTPAASPPYVVVCLDSNNTATSGSYSVFWDNLAVS
jgi:hypothetical protein